MSYEHIFVVARFFCRKKIVKQIEKSYDENLADKMGKDILGENVFLENVISAKCVSRKYLLGKKWL